MLALSVCIALTYAALNHLNGINVLAEDFRNAYLQSYLHLKKRNIICGPEFGQEHQGKRVLIVRALYGGKAADRDFWHHLRNCMPFLGFESFLGDPVRRREYTHVRLERRFGSLYYFILILTNAW